MKQPPYSSTWPNQAAAHAHLLLFICYIVTIVFCASRLFLGGETDPWVWLSAIIILPTLTLLSGIARFLPFQNVLGIGFTTVAGATILALLSHAIKTSGKLTDGFFQGAPLLSLVPILISSAGWSLAIVGGRSSARLILSSLREHRNYGFFLAGMTAALSCFSFCAAEPTWVGQFPSMLVKESPLQLPNLWLKTLIYFIFSGGLTIAVTPWFISKHPYLPPVEITSPISWLILNLLTTTENCLKGRDAFAAIGIALCSLLTIGIGWNAYRRSAVTLKRSR